MLTYRVLSRYNFLGFHDSGVTVHKYGDDKKNVGDTVLRYVMIEQTDNAVCEVADDEDSATKILV